MINSRRFVLWMLSSGKLSLKRPKSEPLGFANSDDWRLSKMIFKKVSMNLGVFLAFASPKSLS